MNAAAPVATLPTVAQVCRRCGFLKAHGTRMRYGKPGPQSYCRECMVAYHTEWRHGPGRETFRASQHASKARYPDRERARKLVRSAVAAGRLQPGPCELASPDCSAGVEAHHDDYSRPLDVRWVCRRHHRQLDRARPVATRRSAA